MKRKRNDTEIKKIINEVELYNAENNVSKKNRVKYYKNKIKELGAVEKTYFTPFKHRLLLNETKKKKKKELKQNRLENGLLYKNKKK